MPGAPRTPEHADTGTSSITSNLQGLGVGMDFSGADQTDAVRNGIAIHVEEPVGCGAGDCLRQHAGIAVEDRSGVGRRYSHATLVRSQSADAVRGNPVLEPGATSSRRAEAGATGSSLETADPCGSAPTGYMFFNDADANGFYCFCDKSGGAAKLHEPLASCF